MTATFRSKDIINFPNFYYHHHHHHHHHRYQKVETQFVLGYFSIRFAFCTHRSSSVKGDKRDRKIKGLPKILTYFSPYLWVINEISRIYENYPWNFWPEIRGGGTCHRGAWIIGRIFKFRNVGFHCIMKGKSEYPRKKPTRRTSLRVEPTKNSIRFWGKDQNKNPNNWWC